MKWRIKLIPNSLFKSKKYLQKRLSELNIGEFKIGRLLQASQWKRQCLESLRIVFENSWRFVDKYWQLDHEIVVEEKLKNKFPTNQSDKTPSIYEQVTFFCDA